MCSGGSETIRSTTTTTTAPAVVAWEPQPAPAPPQQQQQQQQVEEPPQDAATAVLQPTLELPLAVTMVLAPAEVRESRTAPARRRAAAPRV